MLFFFMLPLYKNFFCTVCTQPPSAQANAMIVSNISDTLYLDGDSITYVCNSGLIPAEGNISTCSNNANSPQWSISETFLLPPCGKQAVLNSILLIMYSM